MAMHLTSMKFIDFLITFLADFSSPQHYFSSDKQYCANQNKYFSHLAYTFLTMLYYMFKHLTFPNINCNSIYYSTLNYDLSSRGVYT